MQPLLEIPFSRRFGLRAPLIVAPMAGGPTTPELVAAAGNAGALGFLAGAYLTSAQIAEAIEQTRRLTSAPFGVNLFTPHVDPSLAPDQVASAVAATSRYRRELGLPDPQLTPPYADDFERQFETMLRLRPAAFSFTFGLIDRAQVEACRAAGIFVIGGATCVADALALQELGVDAIVAQGVEAGGHRFVFSADDADPAMGTLPLTRALVATLKIPVIASGGIMDGHGIAAALALGAQAAQLGTAFLACPEAGTSETYRRMLLARPARATRVTRVFSGRLARAIDNRFAREMEGATLLRFPAQHYLTRGIRQEAAHRGEAEFLSLWAGQGYPLIRPLPAAELVETLIGELAQSASSPSSATVSRAAAFAAKRSPIAGLRSPYDKVGGLVHFGRMLDKIRLHRRGALPPAWVESLGQPRGFDGTCCSFLGVAYEELVARVNADDAPSDEAVLAWVFERSRRPSEDEIRRWSENLMKRGWRDAFAERVRFRSREADLPEDLVATMFDFIEIDEGRVPPESLPL